MTKKQDIKAEKDAERDYQKEKADEADEAEKEKEDTVPPLPPVQPGSSEPDAVPPSVAGTSQDPTRKEK